MDTNVAYTNLFEDVVELLAKNDNNLRKVRQIISDTDLVKKPSKKVLLARIDNIYTEANAIVEKLGALGRVK